MAEMVLAMRRIMMSSGFPSDMTGIGDRSIAMLMHCGMLAMLKGLDANLSEIQAMIETVCLEYPPTTKLQDEEAGRVSLIDGWAVVFATAVNAWYPTRKEAVEHTVRDHHCRTAMPGHLTEAQLEVAAKMREAYYAKHA